MSAPDLTSFSRRSNAVRQDFAAKSASNTFAKTLSQKRGSRQQTDFTQGFGRQLPKFQSQFGQRGLAGGGISSGVAQGAMQQFVGDYTRDFGRMTEDRFDQDQQFDFNQSRYTADRDSHLADLHAQKQAMIAQTAQHIAALRPYMGGF